MKKSILCLLCILIFCFMLFQPMEAIAADVLDVNRQCSLTLHYTNNDSAFNALDISIYRVAQVFPNGNYELVSPYSNYPVKIQGITSQTEWADTADTLTAYITADNIQPDSTGKTDETGTVIFSGLKTGLYMVGGVIAENENGTYVFDNFMIYLPTPGDHEYNYDMEAIPKCTSFVPKTEYKVVKLWKDAGHTEERPKSVTVDILRDGVVWETIILNADNNWSYSWSVQGETGVWSVIEKDIPDEYQVTISETEGTFTITNTRPTVPETPDTGDTTPIWLYITAMCISGLILIVLSVVLSRKKTKCEK